MQLVKMRSYWIRWAPNPVTLAPLSKGEIQTQTYRENARGHCYQERHKPNMGHFCQAKSPNQGFIPKLTELQFQPLPEV